jgi:hypothetical protein
VDGFKRISILLTLGKLIDNGITDNLTTMILNSLLVYGALIIEKISNKQICFGCDSCFPKATIVNVYQIGGNFNHHGFGNVENEHCFSIVSFMNLVSEIN